MKGTPNKHSKAFHNQLSSDEKIELVAEGYIGKMMGKGDEAQHNGTLLLTSKRVVFYRKGLLGEVLKTVPFENISSIDTISSMGHRTIGMFYSNNSLEFRSFESKEFIDGFVTLVKSKMTTDTNAPSSNDFSFVEKLEKLSDLHKAGILTDEEFLAKKSEILDRI